MVNGRKKGILQLELLREIGRSRKRFFSIFFIVALGVAFYSGVRSSQPDMELSVDKYYDQNQVMDLRIISTWGFTDADVAAIEKLDGIEAVRGYRSVDAVCDFEDSAYNFTVMEHTDGINEFTVTEGRLPYTPDECLIDEQVARLGAGIQIGDTISVRSGNAGEDLSDSLVQTEYTVVGIGESPMFLTFDRGTCTTGDGDSDGYILVSSDTFCLDYYTQVFVRTSDTEALSCFSDEYQDKVDAAAERIEMIAYAQCQRRYNEVYEEASETLEEARAQVSEAEEQLADALAQLNDGEEALTEAYDTLTQAQEELDAGWEEYNTAVAELEAAQQQLAEGKLAYQDAQKELETQENTLSSAQTRLALAQGAYEVSYAQYQRYIQIIAQLRESLEATRAELDETVSEEAREPVETLLATIQEQLDYYEALVDESERQLEELQQQLTAAQAQVDEGEAQLTAAKQLLRETAAELEQGALEIEAGWRELSDAKATLNSSQTQLEEGWTEYETSREELDEGWEEYEAQKADADAELADAREQIADGEKTLSRLTVPEWTIYDRNSIQTYVEFRNDSERIGKIGEIFPAIFFLVAALVALTTMTRMVSEQRQQIGTMKAIGYGNGTIAARYLIYALSATIGGCLTGVLAGEKILPLVILKAYGILYCGVPEYFQPYHLSYALFASGAAVLCIGIATWAACFGEFRAKPAQLMRPQSPKSGKRILLERIPFLWRVMNFNQKAAARNLFRYKKRFLMTVFGIGGCMGLLLTGFGLRDSILTIANYQFSELFHYDAAVSLDLSDEDTADAAELAESLPEEFAEISEAMALRMVSADVGNDKITKSAYVFVPQSGEMLENYVLLRNRKSGEHYALPEQGVAISEKLALLLDKQVGDDIIINYDGQVVHTEVACIIENYVYHYVYMSSDTYEALFGETPEYTTLFVNMEEPEEAQVREELAQELLADGRFMAVSYRADSVETMDTMLSNLNLVVMVLIVSAAMLAFVVLFNLNNINITERRRELATLRVLGFYDGEMAGYVYRENFVLTLFGILFGVFFGMWLHHILISTVEIDIMMFGRDIYIPSYYYSALLTLLFAVIINGIMFFSLRKIDMVESLKSVE